MSKPFIKRVVLRNYKSIAACDVRLAMQTYLVGPNGAGKSNFLDALRFTSDAIRYSLDHAIRDRGGINDVRRRSRGHPNHFGVRLEFDLDEIRGHYAFEVSAKRNGGFAVKQEECRLHGVHHAAAEYKVTRGKVTSTVESPPPAAQDRLYLVNVSGFEEFRPLYDALSQMGFYNLNPDAIGDLQTPDPGMLLNRDGSNLASVFERTCAMSPDVRTRIEAFLGQVVPGIRGIEHKALGPKETFEFRQSVRGDVNPWRFIASSMSDGTLRAFGVLVSLYQALRPDTRIRLIGIEEPEVALHPAAAGVLMDAIREAGRFVQIVVTSHSPDLLDNPDLSDDSILAVVAEDGETQMGPLNEAGRTALGKHLYTAGELLRMDQLRPDPAAIVNGDQLNLFGASS